MHTCILSRLEQNDDTDKASSIRRVCSRKASIFEGTIDESIRELLQGKSEIVEDVLDPNDAERAAIRKATQILNEGRVAVA